MEITKEQLEKIAKSQSQEQEDGTMKEIEAPTKLPGWHVNYLGPLPTGWDKKEVTPKNPQRRFA